MKIFNYPLYAKRFTLQKGFTLVEIMVVIAIIGFLSTAGLTSYIASQKNGRDARRKTDLETIRQALELYKSDQGVYPPENYCDSSVGVSGNCDCHNTYTTPPDSYSLPGVCHNQPAPGKNWGTGDVVDVLDSHLYSGLVPVYIKNIPVDPLNNANNYYNYEPDCTGLICRTYVLRARLENPPGFYDVTNP